MKQKFLVVVIIALVVLGGNSQFKKADAAFFTQRISNLFSSIITTGAGNSGFGSSTPSASLSVHANASSTAVLLFSIGSSTPSATTTLFSVTNTGHITGSSTSPTLSSCGTAPSVQGDDAHGTVTAGATAIACTITFAYPYSVDPVCTVTPQTGSVVNTFSYTHSTTAMVVTQTALGGTKFDYTCRGLIGR